MNSNKNRGLLLGLLGVTAFAGIAVPAQAKPHNNDVKEARKEVQRARKDVRRADSPEERRDAREDLRDEKRDLREERREGRNRSQYNRPGFGRSDYNRPVFDRTVEGIVLKDLSGNDFTLRLNNGQSIRVLVPTGEPGSLSRGDLVRASGRYEGGTFVANSATVLRNR